MNKRWAGRGSAWVKMGGLALLYLWCLLVPIPTAHAATGAGSVSAVLKVSSSTINLGDSVTLTASITDSASGGSTPTGTVSFMNGGTTLGSATLSETTPAVLTGSASNIPSGYKVGTCGSSTPCPYLSWGDDTFWFYSFTDNRFSYEIVEYDASGQIVRQWEQTGDRYLSGISVDASGKTVTLTGQGGTLQLAWSSFQNANAQASFSTSSLAAGSYSLTVSYGGDTNHSSGSSSSVSLTVNQAPTTVALTSSQNPSTFLGIVTLTATVGASAGGTPTGTVTFKDGGVTLGTGTLSGGQTTFATSALAVATSHTITAVYNGDSNHSASTSAALTQSVVAASSTVTLSASPSPSSYGSNVTFTATVGSPAGGTPTGTVTFKDGTTTLGTGSLTGGVASLAASGLTVGSHSITAEYAGDSSYAAGTSEALLQTVNPAASAITLSSLTNPSIEGDSVTFTAAVSSSADGTPTGSVLFKDGDATLGTVTLSGGVASFAASGLSAGSHTISAEYAGDGTYAGNSSSFVSQTVKALTTVTLTSSASQPIYRDAVTFTATVGSTMAGTPTGVMQFLVDGVLQASTSLTGGTATFATSGLAVGSHSVTASFGGDSQYAGSTSIALTQPVNTASTSVTISASPNPSTYQASVTFTAQVTSPAGGSPTGTVTFRDGDSTLGTGDVSSTGYATLTTATLTTGSRSITATYAGDGNYAESTSGTLAEEVAQAATTITLTNSPNSSTYAGPVTFTAAVHSSTGGTPTGTVVFVDGSTTLGSGTLSEGTATFTTAGLETGNHSITAQYAGDGNYAGSASGAVSQTVNQAATTVSASSSPNPSAYLGTVAYTATVGYSIGAGAPSGTVSFFDNGTPIGSSSLTDGVATLTKSDQTAGDHVISVQYVGDGHFTGSTSSSSVKQTVNKMGTTTKLDVSGNPSTFLSAVQLSATVEVAAGEPTGTVTFMEGGTTLGTATINGGRALITTTALAVGAHSLTAVYAGDSNYAGSTSSAVAQTVNSAAVTAALTASPNPSEYKDNVTFTVVVHSAAGGTPTGTVTIKDGANVLGTADLSSGTATFATAGLTVGDHSITAVYSGDGNYASQSSDALAQTVHQATTSITVASSTLSPTYRDSVTFTATVLSSAGNGATGTVVFMDNGVSFGTASLANGSASFATSSLSGGSHSITAAYSGDSNVAGSSSDVWKQTVAAAPTAVSVTASVNPSTYRLGVTFTAAVSAAAGGTPSGMVTFKDQGTIIGSAALSGGAATLATTSLLVGSHNIAAEYAGDGNYAVAVSDGLNHTVDSAASKVTLGSSVNPSDYAGSVTFTATVNSSAGGTPTGSVAFYDGSQTLGSSALSANGTATFTTSALTVGSHSITAEYTRDTNYKSSMSGVLTQTVNTATSSITIAASPNSPAYQDRVTVQAVVSSPAGGTPAGTVTFKDGSVTLGTGTLSADGTATYSTTGFAVGSHSITAEYAGDSNYAGSTSTAAAVTVGKATTTVSVTSSVYSLTYEDNVTFTARVTSSAIGTLTGMVTFKAGDTPLGTGTLSADGTATYSTTGLAVGSHTITAEYAGDTNYAGSASTAAAVTVGKATTDVALTSTVSTAAYRDNITFTARVSSVVNGIPIGTVTFKDGDVTLATISLSTDGKATFTTNGLSAGEHMITAAYSGDDNFAFHSSGTFMETIGKAAVAVTVTSSTYLSKVQDNLTFSVTIVSAVGGTPTGTVTLKDEDSIMGTGSLSDGHATFTISALSAGNHRITAVYEGDPNYDGGSSQTDVLVLDGSGLDRNQDGQIHLDDLIRFLQSGSSELMDFDRNGHEDANDIKLMLMFIS